MSEEKELIISTKYPLFSQTERDIELIITNKTGFFGLSKNIMISVKNHSKYLSRCYFDDNMSIIIDDNLEKNGLTFLLDSILSLHFEKVPIKNWNYSNEQYKYVAFRYDMGLKQNNESIIESSYNGVDEYDDLPSLESLSSEEDDEIFTFSDSDEE